MENSIVETTHIDELGLDFFYDPLAPGLTSLTVFHVSDDVEIEFDANAVLLRAVAQQLIAWAEQIDPPKSLVKYCICGQFEPKDDGIKCKNCGGHLF